MVFNPTAYSDEPDYPSKINTGTPPDRKEESKRLAAAIHLSLLVETGAKDAGLLESSVRPCETAKPAVLLELGYMDTLRNQQIRDSRYQDKLVAGIGERDPKIHVEQKKVWRISRLFYLSSFFIPIRKEVARSYTS